MTSGQSSVTWWNKLCCVLLLHWPSSSSKLNFSKANGTYPKRWSEGFKSTQRKLANQILDILLLGWWPSPITVYGNNGNLDPGTYHIHTYSNSDANLENPKFNLHLHPILHQKLQKPVNVVFTQKSWHRPPRVTVLHGTDHWLRCGRRLQLKPHAVRVPCPTFAVPTPLNVVVGKHTIGLARSRRSSSSNI